MPPPPLPVTPARVENIERQLDELRARVAALALPAPPRAPHQSMVDAARAGLAPMIVPLLDRLTGDSSRAQRMERMGASARQMAIYGTLGALAHWVSTGGLDRLFAHLFGGQ